MSAIPITRYKNWTRTTAECDLLGLRRDPVVERSTADLVAEADHAGDGGPAVLAEPAVRTAAARAGARAAVRRAEVRVREAGVAGQDRGRRVSARVYASNAQPTRARLALRTSCDILPGALSRKFLSISGYLQKRSGDFTQPQCATLIECRFLFFLPLGRAVHW